MEDNISIIMKNNINERQCNSIGEYRNKVLDKLQSYYSSDNNNLIPQFWWGDVAKIPTEDDKMKAIILGKNPSLKYDKEHNDLKDNEKYEPELTKNLNLSNRTPEIRDILIKKEDAYFYDWWKNHAFKDINIYTMEGIAIYNLFGFYSKMFPDNIKKELSHIWSIDSIKNHIRDQIKYCDNIFLMWISSWIMWRDLLGADIFKGKNIYVVNAKGNCNKSISNAVCMTPEGLDKMYDETIVEERKKTIKKIFE